MIIVALCLLFPALQASDPCAGLEPVTVARRSILTGRIEWSRHTESAGSRTVFYTSLISPNEEAIINQGDEEGVVFRAPTGQPTRLSPPRHSVLQDAENVWNHGDRDLVAYVQERSAKTGGIYRMRALGVVGGLSLAEIDEAAAGFSDCSEEFVGRLKVITARHAAGMIRWTIDPDRNGAPVRIENLGPDGAPRFETRIELKQFDSFWFPSLVETFAVDASGNQRRVESIAVHAVEFNRESHPSVLTPTDIGVEAGVNVHLQKADGSMDLRVWDGASIASLDDYFTRVKRGEARQGPAVLREIARSQALLAARATTQPGLVESILARSESFTIETDPILSAWEKYTASFIWRYQLDTDQIQKALDILKSCQERGRSWVDRHREKIDAFNRELESAAPGARQPADVVRVRAERDRILEPINEIFERELKPRLERLPTRQQRVDSGATSKPSPS
jgi:hypothetical protein